MRVSRLWVGMGAHSNSSASRPAGLPGQEAWSILEERWIRVLSGNAVAHLSVFAMGWMRMVTFGSSLHMCTLLLFCECGQDTGCLGPAMTCHPISCCRWHTSFC